MKIDILGTEYEFNKTTDKDDKSLSDKDGYCDGYAKIIAVETDYNEGVQGCIKDYQSLKNRVMRHEIIHAYLIESGLSEYSENEILVDWIAWQFPKLLKSFNEVGAL